MLDQGYAKEITQPRSALVNSKVFWIPALICVAFMLPVILKYGGEFVVRGDSIQAQVFFIEETKRLLSTGQPFWSWNTGLGTNFIGAYYYTLGDPFVWPLLLFPDAWLPYLIGLSIVLKFVVSVYLCYLYLRLFIRNQEYAFLGSLLFSFSSAILVNTQFGHFNDAVVFFPLLLLATERAFRSRRYPFGLFAFSVALSLLVNLYFFFGQVLFLAVYGVFRFFFSSDWNKNHKIRRLGLLLVEGVLGVLLVSVMVYPTVLYLAGTQRAQVVVFPLSWNDFLYFPTQFLENIRALVMPTESLLVHTFYPNISSWASVACFLPVFGFTFTLVYIRKNHDWLKKLLVFFLILSFIPILNNTFSLWTNENYKRWWYMLALMMALATCAVLENLDRIDARSVRRSYWFNVILAGLLTVPFMILPAALRFANQRLDSTLLQRIENLYTSDVFYQIGGLRYQLIGLGLAAIHFTFLYLFIFKKSARKYIQVYCIVSIVVTFIVFIQLNNSLSFSESGWSNTLAYHYEHIQESELLKNHGVDYSYRIDSLPYLRNYSLLTNRPGLNVFHSSRNRYTDQFAGAAFGADISDPTMIYPKGDGKLRALLSVKEYYFYDDAQERDFIPEGFVFSQRVANTDIYENQNFIPFGFAYEKYTLKSEALQYPGELAGLMLKSLVIDDETEAELGRYLVAYHPDSAGAGQAAQWQADAARLKSAACSDFSANSGGFAAQCAFDQTRVVFFSVPYDAGWSASIDGQPTKIYPANIGFMAVAVPAGNHAVRFAYRTPGLKTGAAVSALALVLLLGGMISSRVLEKRILPG